MDKESKRETQRLVKEWIRYPRLLSFTHPLFFC